MKHPPPKKKKKNTKKQTNKQKNNNTIAVDLQKQKAYKGWIEVRPPDLTATTTLDGKMKEEAKRDQTKQCSLSHIRLSRTDADNLIHMGTVSWTVTAHMETE